MGRLIGSVGLAPGTDEGFDLTTKGDMHGYSSANARIPISTDSFTLFCDSGEALGLKWAANTTSFVVACSDETTALTTGTKVTMRMPYAFTLTEVRASLTTAGTGANLVTVDIEQGGTSILSTLITIDATETTSTTATTAPVILTSALTDDASIDFDVDQIDSGGVSAGLKVYLIGYRVAH